jgi:drug/metabolite transporter (DMT)-like permease
VKTRDVGLLFLLASFWGASFIFIGISAPVLGPFVLVFVRTSIAAVVLFAYARATGQRITLRDHGWKFLLLGLLNVAIPFALISTAELHISSAMASILNATTPLWGALVVAVWMKEALTPTRLLGLALGITGVGMVVGLQGEDVTTWFIISVVMMLTASFFYAFGTAYGKTNFKGTAPLTMAIGQVGSAALIMLPLAVTNPPTQPITMNVVVAMLLLSVVSTAVAYLIYFTLLSSAGATNTMTVTFLSPFFSILWAWLFVGETIGVLQFVGFLVILSGLFLVTGYRPPFMARKTATAS